MDAELAYDRNGVVKNFGIFADMQRLLPMHHVVRADEYRQLLEIKKQHEKAQNIVRDQYYLQNVWAGQVGYYSMVKAIELCTKDQHLCYLVETRLISGGPVVQCELHVESLTAIPSDNSSIDNVFVTILSKDNIKNCGQNFPGMSSNQIFEKLKDHTRKSLEANFRNPHVKNKIREIASKYTTVHHDVEVVEVE